MSTPANSPTKMNVGQEIPAMRRDPDAIDLFTFSASAWLLHRIHYDLPFTTESDGHPGLLVHGPLQGTYMIQAVQWWLGPAAEMRRISYRHSSPAYLGDSLLCGGTVVEVDEEAETFSTELWVKKINDVGEEIVTTSGSATFRLPSA